MMILQLCILLHLLPIISCELTPHEFVEQVNEKRRELAEKNQLGNMRELSWDKDLAVSVVDSWNNETLRDKKNVDFVNIDSYEAVIVALDDSVGKDRQDLIDLSATYLLHFLAPLHDTVGCSDVIEENAKHIYCYLSPMSPVKEMFDNFGTPGTRCSNGYQGVNGLCRFVPTTTTTTSTTKKVTVKTSNSTNNESLVDNVPSSGMSCSVFNTFVFFMFSYFILLF